MNQLIANKLNEEGAIILILDMQVGAEIGLDYNSWLVGKEFMGFKMINPGFHCLFYSSVSKQNEFSTRTVLPLFVRSKEVVVYKWDSQEEQLVDQNHLPEDLVRKYQLSGAEFCYDTKTAAYPFETIGKWMNMTSEITPTLFTRLMDKSAISFILDPTSSPNYNYTETINISQLIKQSELRSQMSVVSDTNPVSRLSQLYIDSSDELKKLCQYFWDASLIIRSTHVVGEFQFAFILFHIGQDYESLLQWKNILFLLTASYSLATSKNDITSVSLYKSAMKSLLLQLSELEEDFFTLTEGRDTEITEGTERHVPQVNRRNFVVKCLESFNQILIEDPDEVDSEVKSSFEQIKRVLKKRFDIVIESSCDGPLVVEETLFVCLPPNEDLLKI